MAKKDKPGYELSGKTSDRIRNGEIVASKVHRETTEEETPSTAALRHAEGHGMGKGSTRNGGV